MQLVEQHVRPDRYTPAFREGAVEAVVDQFMPAAELMGSTDGEYKFGENGIVQLHAPITFRWVLYDLKKYAEDSGVGVEGRAEIIFRGYVAKDRHGDDLAGGLYDDFERRQGDIAQWKLKLTVQLLKRGM